MVAPVLGERFENPRNQCGRVEPGQPRHERALEEIAHPAIVKRACAVRKCTRGVPRDGFGVFIPAQPARQLPRRVELANLPHQRRGGQELLLDEFAEALRDARLVLRQDRRVRQGNVERMPEQGHHGEPVGQRADHCRLAGCGEIAEERIPRGEKRGHDIKHPRRRQQPGCSTLGQGELRVLQPGGFACGGGRAHIRPRSTSSRFR